MRFKSFKSFTLGKTKEDPGGDPYQEGPATEPAQPAVNKADKDAADLEEISQQVPDLTAIGDIEEEGPHGPLGELSVEPEDLSEEEVSEIFTPDDTEDTEEEIKVVETSAQDKAKEPEPVVDQGDAGNSLSGIFSEDEEEENPLANLIKSMPEYTTQEIVEDLNEIQRIIHEWRRE